MEQPAPAESQEPVLPLAAPEASQEPVLPLRVPEKKDRETALALIDEFHNKSNAIWAGFARDTGDLKQAEFLSIPRTAENRDRCSECFLRRDKHARYDWLCEMHNEEMEDRLEEILGSD